MDRAQLSRLRCVREPSCHADASRVCTFSSSNLASPADVDERRSRTVRLGRVPAQLPGLLLPLRLASSVSHSRSSALEPLVLRTRVAPPHHATASPASGLPLDPSCAA